MSNPELSPQVSASGPGFLQQFIANQIPYILMLVLAVVGIGYTDIFPRSSSWYWEVLAPVYGIICIATQWSRFGAKERSRLRLIWTQFLHWGAFFLSMQLVFLPVVQQSLDSDITGLVLLHLLALSTFLAGIYLEWRLCIVGAFLAADIVAVAFLDQATILMVLLAVVIIAVFLLWSKFGPKPSRTDA
jgi:hypothetical protein